MSAELAAELELATDAARRAGAIQLERYERLERIVHKGPGDVVTEVDHLCEELILAAIRGRFPDDAIVAEESGAHRARGGTGAHAAEGAERAWIVDPLDGTVNYANGIPVFCVSIGLAVAGRPALGVVYDPVRDELFSAVTGHGATLDGQPIRHPDKERLSDCVISLPLPPPPPRPGPAAMIAQRRRRRGVGSGLGRRHLEILVGILLAIIAAGTLGYVVLEGWGPGDALYMTVITLTTVGFREVAELDGAGRAWTMLLALSAVGIIFGTVGIAAEYVVEEVTSGRREEKRMRERIAALSGHFVLCGYGRVGATVARELDHAGETVVVVDLVQESLARAQADGFMVVLGDATTDGVLREAGVERARGLITTLHTDAHNVYVILSARELNPNLVIVGRANTLDAEEKLLRAGADRIVSPYVMAGHRLARQAVGPAVVDYLEAALSHREPTLGLESLPVSPGSGLEGRSVGELRADGVVVLAIARGDGVHTPRYEASPGDDRRFAAGESVIVSGTAAALTRLRARA